MTQPTPTPTPPTQPQSTAPGAAQLLASMPVFKFLAQYIQAAASGERATIFHLFVAVFVMARAAVRCLAEHYNTNPRQRTLDTYARLKYCFARIPAILYTLQHAPERFLTPAQLRALTRARAVLAHILNQPVDFSPLTPYLTSPENCPSPPRSVVAPASCRHEPCPTPPAAPHTSPDASLDTPHSACRTSAAADPLLLTSPGRALASVLLQLAAIYGISATPAPAPRPATSSSAPSDPPRLATQSIISNFGPDASLSPRSDLRAPHSENPQSPLRPPP